MRFCDKLPKLRKSNNYSQEQLADKLNVSRQAVSKWEMGSSYPDMDKMLQMCKILNCNLEDIMDDGVIGDNAASPKSSKFNINIYMKDFLNFITRSYNMFCSMKFKQKLKFILEMICICTVLFLIGFILCEIIQSFIANITGHTEIGWIITNIVINILSIIFGIVGLIVALHLFKIRYLDYFVTIEDQNAVEKTIEEPVEKKENKYYQEKPKEKIIIRDTKHSAFRFFEILGKIILFMVKAFAVMCVIPVIAFFACSAGAMMISIYHMQYGIIFFWSAVLFTGLGLLAYIPVEWVCRFVSGKKQHLKRLFIFMIAGLILAGAGTGLAVCTQLGYEKVGSFAEEEYITEKETIPMDDKLIISNNLALPYEYKIDNSVNDIKLEIRHLKNSHYFISYYYDELEYRGCYVGQNIDFFDAYKLLITDIKNKRWKNYDTAEYMTVTVILSQKNYDKLQENYNKLQEHYNTPPEIYDEDFIEPNIPEY